MSNFLHSIFIRFDQNDINQVIEKCNHPTALHGVFTVAMKSVPDEDCFSNLDTQINTRIQWYEVLQGPWKETRFLFDKSIPRIRLGDYITFYDT